MIEKILQLIVALHTEIHTVLESYSGHTNNRLYIFQAKNQLIFRKTVLVLPRAQRSIKRKYYTAEQNLSYLASKGTYSTNFVGALGSPDPVLKTGSKDTYASAPLSTKANFVKTPRRREGTEPARCATRAQPWCHGAVAAESAVPSVPRPAAYQCDLLPQRWRAGRTGRGSGDRGTPRTRPKSIATAPWAGRAPGGALFDFAVTRTLVTRNQ